ncbi:MAG: hypothetical protein KKB31_01945 [Nanoarchaeota archaeon]|nr:hypothetical protein [Nanoarchaeota archaeon]
MKCENCKKLRKKIQMLEKVIDIAQVEEWDLESVYKEILEGCNYGFEVKPNPEFAKWFAKRYDVEED